MQVHASLSPSRFWALVLAAAVVIAWPVAAQDPPTFRAAVSRVTLNVVVRDGHGRPVTGLAGTDFQVFDGSRAVTLSHFLVGDEPISVAILLDTSGSMRIGDRPAAARQAAATLLEHLSGRDEAALFTFDRTLHEVSGFASDLSSVRSGLHRVDPFGSTSLYDAVATAARRLAARASSRRAVVAITDGLDNSSELTAALAASIASSIDVPVYILAVAGMSDPVAAGEAVQQTVEAGATARLDDLTRWTGGATFEAKTAAESNMSVQQIIGDLRAGYVMAFEPHDRPGWHPVTVRVARKNARVRTRAGFWMGASDLPKPGAFR
jgi:VWFA-related protein